MSSRYYIVRPEEVISWNERLSKLHGLTYDQLLQLISPNEVAVEFAARYSLISNSMNCKRCGQMMLLWSRNGLDGLQVRQKQSHLISINFYRTFYTILNVVFNFGLFHNSLFIPGNCFSECASINVAVRQ